MNRTFSNLVKQMKTSISVQQRFYAAAPKGTTAFAGGKLGGGLSSKREINFYLLKIKINFQFILP